MLQVSIGWILCFVCIRVLWENMLCVCGIVCHIFEICVSVCSKYCACALPMCEYIYVHVVGFMCMVYVCVVCVVRYVLCVSSTVCVCWVHVTWVLCVCVTCSCMLCICAACELYVLCVSCMCLWCTCVYLRCMRDCFFFFGRVMWHEES